MEKRRLNFNTSNVTIQPILLYKFKIKCGISIHLMLLFNKVRDIIRLQFY